MFKIVAPVPRVDSFSGSDGSELAVDGANATGTRDVTAIGPTRPHGDNATVTVDASC